MDAIIAGIRRGLALFTEPFLLLGNFWGLTLLSAVVGILILILVGKTTPQSLVERSRNKMASAIYEIRIYLDSPKRIVLSQARLIGNSLLYVLAMLPAFIIMSVPIWILYLQLDARLGLDGLELNQPAVMAIELAKGEDPSTMTFSGEGLVQDGPMVVDASSGEAFVRLRPVAEGVHTALLGIGGTEVRKKVAVGAFVSEVYPERSSGARYWTESFGTEARLIPKQDRATHIALNHATSGLRYLGMPWWLYSMIVMTLAALGLKDRLGVAL